MIDPSPATWGTWGRPYSPTSSRSVAGVSTVCSLDGAGEIIPGVLASADRYRISRARADTRDRWPLEVAGGGRIVGIRGPVVIESLGIELPGPSPILRDRAVSFSQPGPG